MTASRSGVDARGEGVQAGQVVLPDGVEPDRQVLALALGERTCLGLAVLIGGVWGLAAIGSSQGSDAANTAGAMVMVLMTAVGQHGWGWRRGRHYGHLCDGR
ncbi:MULTISPECIES: hypothetical protein [unclassified Streptomyces]|uniref:hypothetical protein n=1 Tax=unclassified Streptomyces TaxID=2593676 RepID=UPI0035DDEB3E